MKNTFEFLGQLAGHNTREWMEENKPWYQEARKEFSELVGTLIKGIGEFDGGILALQPKDCMFRINRDIRFSKNKNPYKTNFGAAITEGGRKTGNPTYYIHLEPGKSMIAAGIYMPDAENLKKIRQEIDYNPEELKKIVEEKNFKSTFGAIRGEALKTAPKGYPKDHPNIELLRFKSYIVWSEREDAFFSKKDFVRRLVDAYRIAYPFNQYLSVAIS
jgi:uncharacterized protein (TIGR02453 family)